MGTSSESGLESKDAGQLGPRSSSKLKTSWHLSLHGRGTQPHPRCSLVQDMTHDIDFSASVLGLVPSENESLLLQFATVQIRGLTALLWGTANGNRGRGCQSGRVLHVQGSFLQGNQYRWKLPWCSCSPEVEEQKCNTEAAPALI